MSDAMQLVSDIEAKIGKNPMALMGVLQGQQLMIAMNVLTAARRKDVAKVETLAKGLAASMVPTQRPKLVAVLGEDIVARLEALK